MSNNDNKQYFGYVVLQENELYLINDTRLIKKYTITATMMKQLNISIIYIIYLHKKIYSINNPYIMLNENGIYRFLAEWIER